MASGDPGSKGRTQQALLVLLFLSSLYSIYTCSLQCTHLPSTVYTPGLYSVHTILSILIFLSFPSHHHSLHGMTVYRGQLSPRFA